MLEKPEMGIIQNAERKLQGIPGRDEANPGTLQDQ